MINGEAHHKFTDSEMEEQQITEAAHSELLSMMNAAVSRLAGKPPTEAPDEAIELSHCRACSDHFEYESEGHITRIIIGVPKSHDYIAASYVWGKTKPLPLRCTGCNTTSHVPMESAAKFRHLAAQVRNLDCCIWIDALSIDQSDPKDIASQLAVMGDIYSSASSVAVSLPRMDGEAFVLLWRIYNLAATINRRKLEFSRNEETAGGVDLSGVCQQFYRYIEEYEKKLHQWVYWSRAWTFQEWALASDISIAWEGFRLEPQMLALKSEILEAATLLAVYKLQQHQYATIKLGFSRGEVGSRFEAIRSLFPNERAFVAPDEVDEEQRNFDEIMPNMSFGNSLGLRLTFTGRRGMFERNPPIHEAYLLDVPLPEWGIERQLHRLSMMLNAFGSNERNARFEADLVACWASMCNIGYDYKKEDPFGVALQKVLKTLRKDIGVTIYNFLVNTKGASGEVDVAFLEYAKAHKQCNASNERAFHGTPIFTGRADTAVHFKNAIHQPRAKSSLKGDGVPLRKVKHSLIPTPTILTDTQAVVDAMFPAVSGASDDMMFYNVLYSVAGTLVKASKEELEKSVLVTPSFHIEAQGKAGGLAAWAICPSDVPISDCFVSREGLNGTLVLAAHTKDSYEIVAYLTLTDQQSGTHLVKVDERGEIDMTFRTPLRGDILNSLMMGDRKITGKIELEEESFLAF